MLLTNGVVSRLVDVDGIEAILELSGTARNLVEDEVLPILLVV